MKVNANRLAQSIEEFAAIGKSGAGVTRLGLSRLEYEATERLIQILTSEGLSGRRDAFSNVFCRREGRNPALPAILIGSHLDTVPNGGRFDGALGVLAAVEVIRVLNEHGVMTDHPIEIVSFAIEESSRFGVGMQGSQAMMGSLDSATFFGRRDREGLSPRDALTALGLDPDRVSDAARDPAEIHAYLELHIEQGRVLEEARIPVGIVAAIAKATRYLMDLKGRDDHSGTTPMRLRRDAAAAAAEIVLMVEQTVREIGGEPSVATVGVLTVEPGAMNVIPGAASLGIDIRDIDGERKRAIAAAIVTRVHDICARREIAVTMKKIEDGEPVPLSPVIIGLMEGCARDRALPFRTMPSGAGHDAMNVATRVPTGMIFVPSKDGRSHSPDEFTAIEEIVPGVELLLDTVLAVDRAPNLAR